MVPVAEVLANVDQRLARENGKLDVLMLSGGEPTLHPELKTLLHELAARPITRILINTNGVLIARDDALLDLLTEHRERVEVYLQYDGSSAEASRHHRGGDLRRLKRQAVARLSEREIFTTLVMTAALGVNDGEIGDVVKVALDTPFVGGVSLQPQFGSGRSGTIDPMDRLTHTGVLKRLGPQTGGLVTWRDLTALPCSHPHCCSVGYLIRDDSQRWRSLVALIGHDRLKENLGLVANRIADSEIPRELRLAVQESLLDLLSEQSSLSHPQIGELWRNICENCDLGVSTLLTLASSALPGSAQEAAPDDGRAGGPDHDQAVHGHLDHDRGTAHAVLRARRHTVGPGPVRAVLRRAGVAAAVGAATVGGGVRTAAAAPAGGAPVTTPPSTPYDPLRLCVYATIALLAWVFGPWALLAFAGLGFAGYWKARRAGLTRSKCLLRDTRLVLAYLGVLALAAVTAIVLSFT
ncbi:radical SAM protein [Nonomuraea ferruginea]